MFYSIVVVLLHLCSGMAETIKLKDFKDILYTEIHNELDFLDKNKAEAPQGTTSRGNIRKREVQEQLVESHVMESINDDAEDILWDHLVEHSYHIIDLLAESDKETTKNSTRIRRVFELDSKDDKSFLYPFLVCSQSSSLTTGFQRVGHIVKLIGASGIIPILNIESQTCYHVPLSSSEAIYLQEEKFHDVNYSIAPFSDLMKFSVNSFDTVTQDYWPPPIPSRNDTDEWKRIIHVALVPSVKLHGQGIKAKVQQILQNIQDMGKTGSRQRRRRTTRITKQKQNEDDNALSVTNMFSLTSLERKSLEQRSRKLLLGTSRAQSFSQSLENGIEADHNCNTMFSSLQVNTFDDNNDFEIILNPSRSKDSVEAIEIASSASNVDCIVSLMLALSTHPSVLHIEPDTPVTPDDYQSQWISQSYSKDDVELSKSSDTRPFFDVGLDGRGQIISMADSGLDINNPYFGPTSDGIFEDWDMSERKVVRYDNDIEGDRLELPGKDGHGTEVAGVILGQLPLGKESEADGVAKGAKLHVYDIKKGDGAFSSVNTDHMLKSMYNNGNGARISNLSWSTGHRAYSQRCVNIDRALQQDYDDVIVLASAGNEGTANLNGSYDTIGDPASCKNTVSVGMTESSGTRLDTNLYGPDYLAHKSSRGPSFDGRMKPDLVAPGYTVLTSRPKPSQDEEITLQTAGTSHAVGVVSGGAAIVRQYFEDGWHNEEKFSPSGSLVKAVLMNGAQDIDHVQDTKRKNLLETIKPYDNNQGMGRVNLLASLPLPDKVASAYKMNVLNNVEIKQESRRRMFIKAKTSKCNSSELSVTLSWYDLPGYRGCTECLVNDLDLWVERILPDGSIVSGQKYRPNGLTSGKDNKNNVERVRFNMTNGHRYQIVVKTTNLWTETAKYSLVATGCFINTKKPSKSSRAVAEVSSFEYQDEDEDEDEDEGEGEGEDELVQSEIVRRRENE